MMCEECGKAPATVHIEQIVNGQRISLHLCQECAQKKGYLTTFLDPGFSLTSLLSAFMGSDEAIRPGSMLKEEARCQVCGMSYRDFARVGKLGCPACYETFSNRLMPLLRRIHGSDNHVGKVPIKTSGTALLRRELEEARKQLSEAIAQEAYERAASLRDKIRALEAKIRGEKQ